MIEKKNVHEGEVWLIPYEPETEKEWIQVFLKNILAT